MIKQILASVFLLSLLPSASFAEELTPEHLYYWNASFTAGSLKTLCILYEEGLLAREVARLFSLGFMEDIMETETGAPLAGSLKGLERSKNDHPSCPLPD